jgi:hypothetical protein
MSPGRKKILSGLMAVIYVVVLGEILLRVIGYVTPINDLELLKYARTMKTESSIPGLAFQHRPNAREKLMGVEFATNALGHRSVPIASEKPADERRIYFAGTSITMGWGVAGEDTFAAVAEKRLNTERRAQTQRRYLAMNAGVANYNAVFEQLLLKGQIEAAQPDAIVMQYFLRDAELDPEPDSVAFKYSVFLAVAYQQLRGLLAGGGGSLTQHYLALHEEGRPSWERAKRAIRETKALADSRRIPMFVVMIPEPHDLTASGPFVPLYARLHETFAEMGIEVIDPLPALRAAFGSEPMRAWVSRADPHPNPAAHKIIGDAVFASLVAAGL